MQQADKFWIPRNSDGDSFPWPIPRPTGEPVTDPEEAVNLFAALWLEATRRLQPEDLEQLVEDFKNQDGMAEMTWKSPKQIPLLVLDQLGLRAKFQYAVDLQESKVESVDPEELEAMREDINPWTIADHLL